MKGRVSAGRVAYPAMLGALSLVLLYLACVAPSGSWGITALAGLLPAGAVISVSLGAGFLCWAGVSLLGLLLLPSKLCALLYAVLFGLYPMVKAIVERSVRGIPGYLIKLLFFNAVFTVVYLLMTAAVLDSFPPFLSLTWVLYLVGNVVFLLYDYGFSKLIAFYIARIHRAMK